MILKVTDKTGHSEVDTDQDIDLARELFKKATERKMWGKGVDSSGKSHFIPEGTPLDELVGYKEVVMLPQQVGG